MVIELRSRHTTEAGVATFVPEWLKDLRRVDFYNANERVTDFLENRRASFPAEADTNLMRSLAAMCLANDSVRLRNFGKAIFDASQTEKALSLPDDANERDPVLAWADRASAIVDGALAGIFLLRPEGQTEVMEVLSSANTELSTIKSARRIARLRRQSSIRFKRRE
jgi:hypothetical protein